MCVGRGADCEEDDEEEGVEVEEGCHGGVVYRRECGRDSMSLRVGGDRCVKWVAGIWEPEDCCRATCSLSRWVRWGMFLSVRMGDRHCMCAPCVATLLSFDSDHIIHPALTKWRSVQDSRGDRRSP